MAQNSIKITRSIILGQNSGRKHEGHHSETHFPYKYFGYSSSRSDSFYYVYILFNYFLGLRLSRKLLMQHCLQQIFLYARLNPNKDGFFESSFFWTHADAISFFLTRKCQKYREINEDVNIDGENLRIF